MSQINTRKSGVHFDDYEEKSSITKEIYNRVEEHFETSSHNMRFYNFVWLDLRFTESQHFPEESLGDKEHTINDIHYFLRKTSSASSYRDYPYQIRKKFNRHALALENLAWLDKSSRATKWIKDKITHLDQDRVRLFPNLTGLSLIQAILDNWNENLSTKKKFVENLEKRWITHIMTDVQLNWLEQQPLAEMRKTLAWEELCLHYQDKFNVNYPPKKLNDILEIFDQLEDHRVSKKEFIKRLQNKLSKQKSADQGKKPKNLDILLSNHKKLKDLAIYWGCTEATAMDRLISEAFNLTFANDEKRPAED